MSNSFINNFMCQWDCKTFYNVNAFGARAKQSRAQWQEVRRRQREEEKKKETKKVKRKWKSMCVTFARESGPLVSPALKSVSGEAEEEKVCSLDSGPSLNGSLMNRNSAENLRRESQSKVSQWARRSNLTDKALSVSLWHWQVQVNNNQVK